MAAHSRRKSAYCLGQPESRPTRIVYIHQFWICKNEPPILAIPLINIQKGFPKNGAIKTSRFHGFNK